MVALPSREATLRRDSWGKGYGYAGREADAPLHSLGVPGATAVPASVSVLCRDDVPQELRPCRSSALVRSWESAEEDRLRSLRARLAMQEDEPRQMGLARRPALTWPCAERTERITARGGNGHDAPGLLPPRCRAKPQALRGSVCMAPQGVGGARHRELWLRPVERVEGAGFGTPRLVSCGVVQCIDN